MGVNEGTLPDGGKVSDTTLPTVDEQTGERVGLGLNAADKAMLLLRRSVMELVRGAAVSEAMTNGDKMRFVHAITTPSLLKAPGRAVAFLMELGDTTGPLASSEPWRYHRAADEFAKYAKAEHSTVFLMDCPDDPITQDGAEEGHAGELAA
jgi:hypothetical protein